MGNSFASNATIIGGVALLLAAALTPVVRAIAIRFGAVAVPKVDRWHNKPTAMLGGIAVYAAVVLPLLFLIPHTFASWVVLGASTALFALGLIDDFFRIKPYQKLAGQLMAAAAVAYLGLVLPWTPSVPLNILITLFWLVGITNAVNMLDNMDGLATGVSAIASAFLAVNFVLNHQPLEALIMTAFGSALLGFLIYNHNPASIFMGDCGSMFIGFFLASAALLNVQGGGRSRSVVAVLIVPVLVLFVPIFDTTFVTLLRKLAGRAASQGGRDHTSHRLVALGLSEKHAVWMLYAFAFTAGMLALLVRNSGIDVSLAAISVFALALTGLGVYLGRVRVYDETTLAAAREKPLVAFLVDLSYKRRIFEVLLDVILVALSYYGAYALRFGPMSANDANWALFLKTLPVVLFIKMAALLVAGVYRGLWQYASVANVIDFAKAAVLGSVLTILTIVLLFRFDGFSRAVFVFDGLLLLLLVSGSRFSFRMMRRLFPAPHARTGKRVLIFGAGDGGELLFRELVNNAAMQYVPVAFMDDDPHKGGRLLHGLRVHHSGQTTIVETCRKLQVDWVMLSTAKIADERIGRIVAECAPAGIGVVRAAMTFQRLSPADFGWVVASEPPPAPGMVVVPLPADRLLRPIARPATGDH